MRRRIEADSGIKAYDIYGLSEIIGPGVAMECHCQAGPHIFEDYFYPEIIDPEDRQALPGRRGRRAGPDHARQASHADDPLSHAGHHGADFRDLRMRAHPAAHQAHQPPRRRHVHHSRRQCLSVADRDRAAEGGGRAAALPDCSHAREGPRCNGGAGRSHAGSLQRHGGRRWSNCRPSSASPSRSTVGVRANVRLVQPRTIQRSEGKAKRVIDQRKM